MWHSKRFLWRGNNNNMNCKNYSMEKKKYHFCISLSHIHLPTSDIVLSVVARPLAMFSLSRTHICFVNSAPLFVCVYTLDSCEILYFLWSWYHFSSTLWNFSLHAIYTAHSLFSSFSILLWLLLMMWYYFFFIFLFSLCYLEAKGKRHKMCESSIIIKQHR